MANYSIVINSRFRPFSYDDMIKPINALEQRHALIEEQLADLGAQAAKWDTLANQQTDKRAYAQYKKYATDLESAADDLAKNGLSNVSRQNLYNMRTRYNSEIAPIELAYQLRAADIKAQNEMNAKSGGRTVFTKQARTASLDDYLNGLPMDYSSINLNDMITLGAKGSESITKRYFNTKEGQRFRGQYLQLVKEQGISPTDTQGHNNIIQALRHSGQYPELDKFYNDTLASYNVSAYSEADQAKILASLDQGMNMGIYYNQSEDLKENWMAKMRAQARMAVAAQPTALPNRIPGDTVAINLTDRGAAGQIMKKRMANQTMIAVLHEKEKGNKEAAKLWNQWLGMKVKGESYADWQNKVSDYIASSGINVKRDNGGHGSALYYAIGNNIRDNVTRDENLINIWRAPYTSPSLNSYFDGRGATPDLVSDPQTSFGSVSRPRAGSVGVNKDWKNFDDLAVSSYRLNAIQLREDPKAVENWLNRKLNSGAMSHGDKAVRLYDIKNIDSRGNIVTGKAPTKISDLPLKNDGSIDTSGMTRTHLSDGNLLISYRDSKGVLHQKVLKAADISEERAQFQRDRNDAYNATKSLGYPQAYTNQLLESILQKELDYDYHDVQVVDVPDYKLP